MKSIISFLSPFLYSLLLILFPQSSFSYLNDHQDITTYHQTDTKQSSFINLEQYLSTNVTFTMTLDPPKSCQLLSPSLSVIDDIHFEGSFPNGEKVFFNHEYSYVLQIDPQDNNMNLIRYDMGVSNKTNEQTFFETIRFTYPKEEGVESDIQGSMIHGSKALFRTKSHVLVFNFEDPLHPELSAIIKIDKSPIQAFCIVKGSTLYIAGQSTIVAYDISNIEENSIKTAGTFNGYALKNNQERDVGIVRAICVCDEIVFLAEGTYLLAFQQTQDMFSKTRLTISKVVNLNNDIVQIQKVGRSLVVLTTRELVEYLFVTDCLDLQENLRISVTLMEFLPTISIQDAEDSMELKGSDKGRYFAVTNKPKISVYIFESGVIRNVQDAMTPYLAVYKSPDSIVSVDIYELFQSYSMNGLAMILKHKQDQVTMVAFRRNAAGMTCSNWMPTSEVVTVKAEARFCHNTMYNYTTFVGEQLQGKGKDTYSDDFYFNPMLPCKHTMMVEVQYAWSFKAIISLVCIIIAVITVIGIIVKVCCPKKKRVAIYRGHMRFRDEGKELDFSGSNHKIDISSLSLPSTDDRRRSNSGIEKKDQNNAEGEIIKPRKKNYSKKKNLTIKIPEIK